MLSHGNGPQVGLLALQAAAYTEVEAYPLDVLGAQTEGMIGYLIEQELGNLLPAEVPFATHPHDDRGRRRRPGLRRPDQVRRTDLRRRATPRRWRPRRAGCSSATATSCAASCRRRRRKRIFEIRPIRWLLEHGVVVICAGGGGIPTTWVPGEERTLAGVEAVIDKDLASELLAREIDADLFVMATDVDGVYEGWGTPEQRRLDRVTPDELRDAARSPPGRWARRSRPRPGSSRRPASAPPSARSPTSSRSSTARAGTNVRAPTTTRRGGIR